MDIYLNPNFCCIFFYCPCSCALSFPSVGSWSLQQGFSPDPSFSKKPIKRFFRVGTVARTPWTMVAEDGSLSGYCPLMLKEMAKRMDFGYELILPTDNSNDFGKKGSDGQWSGVVGLVIIIIICVPIIVIITILVIMISIITVPRLGT